MGCDGSVCGCREFGSWVMWIGPLWLIIILIVAKRIVVEWPPIHCLYVSFFTYNYTSYTVLLISTNTCTID